MMKSRYFTSIFLLHIVFFLFLSLKIDISQSADTLTFVSKGNAPQTGSSLYYDKKNNKLYAFGGTTDSKDVVNNIESVSVTSTKTNSSSNLNGTFSTSSFSFTSSFASAGSVSTAFSYGAFHVLTIDNQEYAYIFGGMNNRIQRASTSSLTSFTTMSETLQESYFGGATFRTESFVYLISGSGTKAMYRASVSNPTSWTNIGNFPVLIVMPGVFTYKRKVYLIGGSDTYLGNTNYNTIYYANFDALDKMTNTTSGVWSLSTSKLPDTAGSSTFFMSNTYAYMTSGTLGKSIYRAALSSLTTWSDSGLNSPYSASLTTAFSSGNTLLYYAGIKNPLFGGIYSRSDFYVAQIEEFQGCFSVPISDLTMCNGRGQCVARDSCVCLEGYYGDACQFERACYGVTASSSNVCSGNGKCVGEDSCVCNAGASGSSCSNFTCFGISSSDSSNVCSGNGNCLSPDNCQCKTGYTGQKCDSFSCYGLSPSDSKVCSGLGPCIGYNNCSCPSNLVEDCSGFGCNGISATNPKVCSGNGICTALDTCICNETFSGQFCNVFSCFNISNDDSKVCSGKGVCLTSDKCSCQTGYSGTQCELFTCSGIGNLDSSVCSGNGSCISPDKCQCNEGWNGDNCEIPSCFGYLATDGFACSGYGVCVSNNSCLCNQGFSGQSCEIYSCNGKSNQETQCSGNGQCSPHSLTCTCNENYFGMNCEYHSCYGVLNNQTNVCSGHGSCLGVNNCSCESGYFGYSCELPSCDGIPQVSDLYKNMTNNPFENLNQNPCNGRGNCIALDVCQCDSGYLGKFCQDFKCFDKFFNDSNVCSGNGSCQAPNKCQCQSEFFGSECQQFNCFDKLFNDSTVCSGNGTCKSPNNCQCQEGFYGNECQSFKCFNNVFNDTNVCSGNGTCQAPNMCQCQSGFFGTECESFKCFDKLFNNSNVCSGNGTCNSPNNCECQHGFYGSECESFNCQGIEKSSKLVCSSFGSCISPDNCKCKLGYYGPDCSKYECSSLLSDNSTVCSGNGICISPDNCQCKEGFLGANCEQFYCFGKVNNESNVCGGNGECSSLNTCSCKDGYFGKTCQNFKCGNMLHNSSLVCSGNGSCLGPNNCKCLDGYYGNMCELFECNGKRFNDSSVCSGNGLCRAPNNCQCQAGFFGIECQGFKCFDKLFNDSNVCSGNGTCKSPNNCHCQSGFFGNECQDFKCFDKGFNDSKVCSGNGTCQAPNNCQCQAGFFGNECQSFKCFDKLFNDSNVCSGNGTCKSPNNCECQHGFYGSECESFNCQGIEKSSKLVCSSFGSCISPDNCKCKLGYHGSDCSKYECSGIIFNNSKVCSGNGNCSEPETCSCKNAYYGSDCSNFECNGILFNNSTVCSGNGNCTQPNSCLCKSGFYGKSCELFKCFSTQFNDTAACSGNGQCTSPNSCKCKEGFYGYMCDKFNCFGLKMTDEQVCSQKGNCIGKDLCQCEYGYFGKNCSQIGCFGIASTNTSVCSNGNGKCTDRDQCQCLKTKDGYYFGNECEYFANTTQVSFRIDIDVNRKEVLSRIGEERFMSMKVISSLSNVTFLVWCNNCTNFTYSGYENAQVIESSDLLIDASDLPIGGAFEFSVLGKTKTVQPQFSNIRKFVLAIVRRPIDPSEVRIESLETTNFPKAIIYSSSIKFDFILSKLTFNYLEGSKFLMNDCISLTEGSCQLRFNYNVTVFDTSKNVAIGNNLKGKGSAFAPLTNNATSLKLAPAINIQFTLQTANYSTSSIKIVFSFGIESENYSFQIYSKSALVTVSGEGAKPPSNYQVQISPQTAAAIVENFTIVSPVWISDNENFNPLRYAFGFFNPNVESKKAWIRLTEYSINPTAGFPLPFLSKQLSTSMQVDVVIFVVDSQGNTQYRKIGKASVSPFQGILPAYLSDIERSVLAFDQFTLSNTADSSVLVDVVKSITVNTEDPESSLKVLDSLTSDSNLLSNPSVASQVADTVSSFLTSALELYQNELKTNGYVASKMSEEAKSSAVSVISNLFTTVDTNSTTSSSSSSDIAKKTEQMILSFSKLVLASEVPKVLETSDSSALSLPVLQYNTQVMNITFSSFIISSGASKRSSKAQDTYQLTSGESNIKLNLNEIVGKYGGYSKPLGLSLVTFEKNTKVDNFSLANPISSIINELKYYQNSDIVKLNDLNTPISLQFGINSASLLLLSKGASIASQEKVNQTQNVTIIQEPYISCMYWDENENGWRDYGCKLVSFDNITGKAECACTHTTKFSTFVQYKKRNITTLTPAQVAAALSETTFEIVLNSFEIVAGVFFAFASFILLVLLIVYRKKQPIQSRMLTPYIGMAALLVENVLVSILQKGLLLQDTSNSSSNDNLIFGANLTGNICMIIVNTLNITAIFAYLVQVIRFQFMKSLYEKIKRTRTEPSKQTIQFLKFITSTLIFSISVFVCACINLILWTVWVAILRSNAIDSSTYTKGSAICYAILLIGCSILISITIIVDIFTTVARDDDQQIAERAKSKIFSPEELKNIREGMEEVQSTSAASPRSVNNNEVSPSQSSPFELRKLFRKFLHRDEPLYFRVEMLFFLTCFVFCIIQLVTGLIIDQIKSESTPTPAVRALSVIQFIFEILYSATYLFVFGGFSLLVLMKQKKATNNNKPVSEADALFEDSEVMELFQDVQGFEIFEEFAQKEFSVENIYLYSELLSNKQVIAGNSLSKLPNFLQVLSDKFIENGSTYEVNIPSSTKKEFDQLRKTLKEKEALLKNSGSQHSKEQAAHVVDIILDDEAPTTTEDHNNNDNREENVVIGKNLDEENSLKAKVLNFFDALSRQVAINLSDTFGRFANTKSYKSYRKNREIIQNMVKKANVEQAYQQTNSPNVV